MHGLNPLISLSVHSRSFSGLHKAHAVVTHLLLCVDNLYLPAAQHLILRRQPLPFVPRDHQHSDPCLDVGQLLECPSSDNLTTTKRAHAYVCLHTLLSSESYCFLQRLTVLVSSLYLRQSTYERKRFVLTQFWRLQSIISWTHCFQS